MFYIRTTKTGSGAVAVQVVRYVHRKTVIVKHIGSTQKKTELTILKQTAAQWIETITHQTTLFPLQNLPSRLLALDKCQYVGFRYGLLYEVLSNVFIHFKFHLLQNTLLTDLVIARIVAPGSKQQSLEFLNEFFGIHHHRSEFYRQLPQMSTLQDMVEDNVLAVAKKEFHFSASLVFYDVTTLYFESFEADELRKPGFSKDNKSQQPQILIGLLVTPEGFPIAYQIFEGNTFEGHTFLPVISAFKRKYKIKDLTVVADAAMISLENITTLKQHDLHYIIGAKTASLSRTLIQEISMKLRQQDGATVRIPTDYGELICEFSAKRFAKDQREMNKQITKAEKHLENSSGIKRMKFIKATNQHAYALHTELIEKTKVLLGIKGYYTDLGPETSDRLVLEHYHSLWHVEQAFRIAKSDLKMRPIYHYKEYTIKVHVLICFMALAICKFMELKSGRSTKHIVKVLKSVTDARIINTVTHEEIILRSEIKEEIKQLILQLNNLLTKTS